VKVDPHMPGENLTEKYLANGVSWAKGAADMERLRPAFNGTSGERRSGEVLKKSRSRTVGKQSARQDLKNSARHDHKSNDNKLRYQKREIALEGRRLHQPATTYSG